MARIAAVLAFIAATLAACSMEPRRAADAELPPVVSPLGIWEYPASAYPTMCITFLQEGRLQFRGGFEFFNPGRWERASNDGLVRITLGGTTPFPVESVRHPPDRGPGALVAFDRAKRQAVYRIDRNTRSFEFGGFIFYRTTACSAA